MGQQGFSDNYPVLRNWPKRRSTGFIQPSPIIPPWTPNDLGSRLRVWGEFGPSYCFTDTGSTPAVSGSAIQTMNLRVGPQLKQPTAANRPTMLSSGDRWYGQFDGGDWLVADSYIQDSFVGQFFGFRCRLDSASTYPCIMAVRSSVREVRGFSNTGKPESLVSNGSAAITASTTNLAGTTWRTVVINHDYVADTAAIYIGGISEGTGTDTTNSVIFPANEVVLGARTGGSIPWIGGIQEFIYGEGVLSVDEVTNLTNYLTGTWSPLDLGSALMPCVFPALSRAQGKLWQNAGKTIPAIAHGDPVYVATCPFTNLDWGPASDAQRMTLQTDGTYWWLLSAATPTALGLYSPVSAVFSGDSFLSFRASETTRTGTTRIVQSNTVNASCCPGRTNGNAVYCVGLLHAGPLITDGNAHTCTLQKASGGNWSMYLDGISVTINNRTDNWGRVGIGRGGTLNESWFGRFYGMINASSNLSAIDRAKVEAYLAQFSPS